MSQKVNVAHLIRTAGDKAKLVAENQVGKGDLTVTNTEGGHTRIFNVLQYAESNWGLGMSLYPVQRFLVKLYYHLPLNDKDRTIEVTDMFKQKVLYHLTEVEYLRYLFNEGRCNFGEQDHMRRQLILAIGRRSGKTTLSAVFASYELYRLISLGNPQAYYGLPNGNRIQIISVATDKDQAGLLFNDVTSHMAKCEFFKPYIANNTQSHVQFRTPYDISKYGPTVKHENGKFTSFNGKASIRVTFKAAVSKGLRGAGNIVIILDEMAHFQDKGAASAKGIYDAISPSALAFSPKDPNDTTKPIGPVESRIISISSPLNKVGKFWELFHFAMSRSEGSDNMLAIQAPTWEVNPTVEPNFLKEKFHEDPVVFMTEYGAEFSDRIRGWIEDHRIVMECVKPEARPITHGLPRRPHQMGLDLALIGDGTSVSITHVDSGRIVHDYHETWFAGVPWRETNPHLVAPLVDYAKSLDSQERLDFEQIANWIEALCKRFYITDGIFDRWNGLPLEQNLHKRGLKQFRSEFFTRDEKSRMYQAVKLMMYDHRLDMYDFPIPGAGEANGSKHSAFIQQLFDLQASQLSKNQVLVEAPPGYHDDMADAFVRSVWLSLEKMSSQKVTSGSQRTLRDPNSVATLQHYTFNRMRSHGVFRDRLVSKLSSRR